MNTAIIVAGGVGSRFGGDNPKQFFKVNGKPIIEYSLETFGRCGLIQEIVVVVSSAQRKTFDALINSSSVTKVECVTHGGSTRAASVRNGFARVSPRADIVIIHDAARPLVSVDEIERTIEAAAKVGAACLTAPLADTIKTVSGERVTGTIDRTMLRRALTPQAFRRELLDEVLRGAELNASITDECRLVEQIGKPVAAVPGNPHNIKITFPEDIVLMAALMAAREGLAK